MVGRWTSRRSGRLKFCNKKRSRTSPDRLPTVLNRLVRLGERIDRVGRDRAGDRHRPTDGRGRRWVPCDVGGSDTREDGLHPMSLWDGSVCQGSRMPATVREPDPPRLRFLSWRRRGPLRPTTAELIRVKRHKFPDAHRRPAGHPLHAVRHSVIPTRPVQRGHRHQMPGQVVRQPRPFQLPFPILRGDVRLRGISVHRRRYRSPRRGRR